MTKEDRGTGSKNGGDVGGLHVGPCLSSRLKVPFRLDSIKSGPRFIPFFRRTTNTHLADWDTLGESIGFRSRKSSTEGLWTTSPTVGPIRRVTNGRDEGSLNETP